MVYSSGLENRRAFTAFRQFESGIFRKHANNEGNICETVTHKTEAEEVTVGNQLMLELYGIVECKLLDINFIREQGERPR